MNCSGIDVATGAGVEIAFGETVESVSPSPADGNLWIAPGFIDLQVNGFGGVDNNSQIGRAHV